ncbi:DUF1045 domain-containing protein [Terrihabitans sp. B22-R8]|uniref:DUF1045 domain-containing protein n=1 Tax=Terrihabitans sp. B22-R8 TaxID=3425128 RepID=UPI00403D442C
MARYAIYFAPERDTKLWAFGCRVLGRDPETGEDFPLSPPEGVTGEDWRDFTASARRYGFHATLKAPFSLAEGCSEADLERAMSRFGREHAAFEVSALTARAHGDYVALLLSEADARVQALGAACVSAFDDFRAPMRPDERAKRLKGNPSQSERQNLDRWGYPYVFGAFVFHMTLAGPLPKEKAGAVLDGLAADYGSSVGNEPVRFASLSLYREPEAGSPFRLVSRHRLEG